MNKVSTKIAVSLKSVFQPEVPLTIHWDGKMIENMTGHESVDHLPILVSGKGVDQILAVPKVPGESAASTVYETAFSWGLCDQIKCLSLTQLQQILDQGMEHVFCWSCFGWPVVITLWISCWKQ
jgi:hypothetical protein